MDTFYKFSDDYFQYLKLLAREYPTKQDTFTELINLMAILHLPKGTEHFMSDLHEKLWQPAKATAHLPR